MLCIALCAIFLFSACGNGDGSVCGTGGTPQQQAEEQRTCWQKSLLEMFYENLGSMTAGVYKHLTSEDILTLMIIAFSLWMAFQILRHVSAPVPESIGEFWTKILRKATLCFACGVLASQTTYILYVINTFVFPIYVTLLEFCAKVIDTMADVPQMKVEELVLPGGSGDDIIREPYVYSFDAGGCRIPEDSAITMSEDKFPTEPLDLMGCMACAVSDRLNVGYSIGIRTLCSEFFTGVIIGAVLLVMFTITKLGFALYLVDSIFRLDMMIIIMPFLILFYPFEQTRKWSGVGFKIILHSAAIILCFAIIVTMTMLAMQNVLLDTSLGEFGDIENFRSFGIIPISMLFLGFVIIKACAMSVSLADSLIGVGGDNKFQKKAAAVIGTVAKGLFIGLTMGAGKIVTVVAEHSARVRAVIERVHKMQEQAQRARNRLNSLAGRNQQTEDEEEEE